SKGGSFQRRIRPFHLTKLGKLTVAEAQRD
ncbi:MAG: hypothetical protein RL701_14, partial [Pseudomonadota bacterium]